MAFGIILPIRLTQCVLAMAILGLTAYIIYTYNGPNAGGYSPLTLNYFLFCSVFTLLALAYLVVSPLRFAKAAHKHAILGVETLTMLFWFGGLVAMAVFWTDRHCGDQGGACGCGTAATTLGGIEWALFVFTSFIAVRHVHHTRNKKGEEGPPPEMEIRQTNDGAEAA